MKYVLAVLAVLVTLACNNNAPTNSTPSETDVPLTKKGVKTPHAKNANPASTIALGENELEFRKTVSAGKVRFYVSSHYAETSTILVESDGLEVRKYENEFIVEGKLKDAFGLDLNDDGFFEVYLVIQKTDDSGNLDILGIASYKDKSAGESNCEFSLLKKE